MDKLLIMGEKQQQADNFVNLSMPFLQAYQYRFANFSPFKVEYIQVGIFGMPVLRWLLECKQVDSSLSKNQASIS